MKMNVVDHTCSKEVGFLVASAIAISLILYNDRDIFKSRSHVADML